MSGQLTWSEIQQQADLWPATLETVRKKRLDYSGATVVTGAGTSAYAAAAIASAWPNAQPVPSTDLLTENLHAYPSIELLVSIARSGNSPESVAVVKRVQRELPNVRHLAITCNADGQLAKLEGVQTVALDPRTNDRSLVMTSSFSNLVVAGAAGPNISVFERELPGICERFKKTLPLLREAAATIAWRDPSRVVFLGSGPMLAAAREGALKVLEMTAGQVVTVAETFLGLRHGPMSFLRDDTVVVCFLSSDSLKRRYEEDLIRELRAKQLGFIVGITPDPDSGGLLHQYIPAIAPNLDDEFRTSFEIAFAQVLGFELSVRLGLDPDNPSPDGVITRVVQTFQIHHND